MKKDQYNNPVPSDLVVLDLAPPDLSMENVGLILKARWYALRNDPASYLIFVSADEINALSETDPLDAGINIESEQLDLIDEPLKRWDDEIFYHS